MASDFDEVRARGEFETDMNLFVGNFDFEHHLGRSAPRTLPASIRRLNAELAYSFVAIAQTGDFVWAAERPEPGYAARLATFGFPDVRFVDDASPIPPETALVPWGWTSRVKAWGTQNGWRCDCPDLAAVATANSRAFSSGLEREWNVGLPLARPVSNLQEFHDAAADATRDRAAWVVKAEFGMSARERCLGRGSPPSHGAARWVRKQLAHSGAVYFEPWVERLEEWGFQFTVPPAGAPVLEGITPLLTDTLGTYRGSRIPAESRPFARADETDAIAEIVARAAHRIQQLGYFGPLGIDAMRYRTAEGEIRWRPLQDINARLTMGRLALGLRPLVAKTEHASWLHLPRPNRDRGIDEQVADIERSVPTGTRVLRTSPIRVGDRPASRVSLLVIAASGEALRVAEETLTQLTRGRPGHEHR